MITINVIQRVFHLRHRGGTGTCFTIEHDGKQYFVTAKHVVFELKDDENIELYYHGNWVHFPVKIIGHHQLADASVFTIDILIHAHELEPSSAGIALGQDIYFLGFPYRMQDEKQSPINRNFPLPLIKKATLSCMTSDHTGDYYILDGINNNGFSGGPFVFKESNKGEFKVAGIISGYHSTMEPVFNENKPTPLKVQVNTGLIIAYCIKNAIDLIKANPNGKTIPSK